MFIPATLSTYFYPVSSASVFFQTVLQFWLQNSPSAFESYLNTDCSKTLRGQFAYETVNYNKLELDNIEQDLKDSQGFSLVPYVHPALRV